jgi:shikimate kinase
VFLSAPYALLRLRIKRKEDRPMFRDDLSTHELYANRIRYYRMSDITIDIREEETPVEIVERLVLELPKNVLDAARRSTFRRRA